MTSRGLVGDKTCMCLRETTTPPSGRRGRTSECDGNVLTDMIFVKLKFGLWFGVECL